MRLDVDGLLAFVDSEEAEGATTQTLLSVARQLAAEDRRLRQYIKDVEKDYEAELRSMGQELNDLYNEIDRLDRPEP